MVKFFFPVPSSYGGKFHTNQSPKTGTPEIIRKNLRQDHDRIRLDCFRLVSKYLQYFFQMNDTKLKIARKISEISERQGAVRATSLGTWPQCCTSGKAFLYGYPIRYGEMCAPEEKKASPLFHHFLRKLKTKKGRLPHRKEKQGTGFREDQCP